MSTQAFTALTSVEFTSTASHTRYESNNDSNLTGAGASYDTSVGARYTIVFSRSAPYPRPIGFLVVDANPSSATYGEMLGTPTYTTLTGHEIQGTSWHESEDVSYSAFSHLGTFVGSTPTMIFGSASLNLIHHDGIAASLTSQVLRSCAGGASPTCLMHGASAAGSERFDGTDRVMVSYLVASPATVDDWTLSSFLVTPGGAITSLSDVQPCPNAPCVVGFSVPDTRVAYNRQADLFLAVSAIRWNVDPYLTAQWYDGTTGGLVGSAINLGTTPFAGIDAALGVSCHPSSDANPDESCTVVWDHEKVFEVKPDGTFTSSVLDPDDCGAASWTLQWVDASTDSYSHEQLCDFQQVSGIASSRTDASLTGGTASLLNGGVPDFAEALAYSHKEEPSSIAVWSNRVCYATCSGGLYWRLVDHL